MYIWVIPMEWNMEGFIEDMACLFWIPQKTTVDSYGDYIPQGAVEYWENEVDSLKNDPDALMNFIDVSKNRVACIQR